MTSVILGDNTTLDLSNANTLDYVESDPDRTDPIPEEVVADEFRSFEYKYLFDGTPGYLTPFNHEKLYLTDPRLTRFHINQTPNAFMFLHYIYNPEVSCTFRVQLRIELSGLNPSAVTVLTPLPTITPAPLDTSTSNIYLSSGLSQSWDGTNDVIFNIVDDINFNTSSYGLKGCDRFNWDLAFDCHYASFISDLSRLLAADLTYISTVKFTYTKANGTVASATAYVKWKISSINLSTTAAQAKVNSQLAQVGCEVRIIATKFNNRRWRDEGEGNGGYSTTFYTY